MVPFLVRWAESTWSMLLDSALFFFLGLLLAGLLWLVLNEQSVARLLRRGKKSGVVKAALVGVPLPLCSCSVLPVASQLRRSGVDAGPVAAFLIATPESGIDSILLTYSLTDPLLTVARPVAAFVTALAAGFLETATGPATVAPALPEAQSCTDGCCCTAEAPGKQVSWHAQVWSGIRYAALDLLPDLAPYLVFGFLLAGLVGALLPDVGQWSFAGDLRGWVGYASALIAGIPMYICATSSTPLAATMLAAGFSPGAILVFLLVGPATNLTTITVVRRILGSGGTLRYLAAIVVMAVLCGLTLDWAYGALGWNLQYATGSVAHEPSGLPSILAAAVLAISTTFFTLRRLVRARR